MVDDNMKRVKNVLLVILVANILVAILKIVVGGLIKSTSMSADGFHSLSDGASNVVGLVGIWYASKPVDLDHPYGHRKFETLAGLFIGGMLIIVGVNVASNAFQRFFSPVTPNITLESIITLILTLGINIFVSWFEYREGKTLNSQILISDSLHTKSDIYVSMGVLITLVGIKFGLPMIIDPIASVVVAFFVFHAAYEILKEASGVLVDKVVVDSDKIREIVLEFSDVKNVHQIRSRGRADDLYIDLHIMTEPSMSVEKSHLLTHNIENRMKEVLCTNTQVIVHLEPYYNFEEKNNMI
jgi:cation diffusion facilitator family transporter